MKAITKISEFITALKEMESEEGEWIVYPELIGHKFQVDVIDNVLKFQDSEYDFNEYLLNKDIHVKSENVSVIIAPNNEVEWIDKERPFSIGIQVKNKMDDDLNAILENCYLFTADIDSELPTVPYYRTFNSLYKLLNSLNGLDIILRTTDWMTLGIRIKKGTSSVLYIKSPIEVITTIKEISYKVGRTGIIIPIVKFDPVCFDGILVVQTTLHNSKLLSENKLKVNDIVTVKIKRQGYQSTEITSVIYPFDGLIKNETITRCPSCNSVLINKKKNNFLICNNVLCHEKLIKRIIFWCSADSMSIKGLGSTYIEFLVRSKKITTIADLYILTKEDLLSVPGILDKMADNILTEIEESKKRPLADIFSGLGIEGLGKSASKILSWHLSSIYNFMLLKPKEVKRLSTFLTRDQIDNINDFLNENFNMEILLNLNYHLNPKLPDIKTKSHKYFKKTFILKGSFSLITREKLKTLLKRAGIVVLATESKDYDYCLYNSNRRIVQKINKNKTIRLSKLLQELIC